MAQRFVMMNSDRFSHQFAVKVGRVRSNGDGIRWAMSFDMLAWWSVITAVNTFGQRPAQNNMAQA